MSRKKGRSDWIADDAPWCILSGGKVLVSSDTDPTEIAKRKMQEAIGRKELDAAKDAAHTVAEFAFSELDRDVQETITDVPQAIIRERDITVIKAVEAVAIEPYVKTRKKAAKTRKVNTDEAWREGARRHLELLVYKRGVDRPDALLRVADKFSKSLDAVRKATVGVAKARL